MPRGSVPLAGMIVPGRACGYGLQSGYRCLTAVRASVGSVAGRTAARPCQEISPGWAALLLPRERDGEYAGVDLEENKALVRRYYQEVLTGRDRDLLARLCSIPPS